MNFTRIEYFLVAAKYLNFTKAANVLFISQPSLSKQIAILEDEIGVKLFERSKKSIHLTQAGRVMYVEFSRLLPEAQEIIRTVKLIKNNLSRSLSIGCVEALSLGKTVTNIIREFSEKSSDVELSFDRCDFEIIRNKIQDGSLDVAFTISHQMIKMKDIVCTEIDWRKRYIILSTAHPLAHYESIELSDLKNETLVLLDREKTLVSYEDIFIACKEQGFTPNIRYVPNNNTLLDYIELGSCVALLDKSFVDGRHDRLKYFPVTMKARFCLVCIWKRNNTNPALKEFLKLLPSN